MSEDALPPLLITGGQLHTRPGRTVRADLRTLGTRIVGDDRALADNAQQIDATGASVVPLLVNTVFDAPSPPEPGAFDLLPGRPATFAVIRGQVSVSRITSMLVVDPHDLLAVVVAGTIVVRDGESARPVGSDALAAEDPRLGSWTDTSRDMIQQLTPDGRYTETRDGRRNAYTGRFWLDRDRITYLDDTGFWAFGQYHNGVLHHAGYVLYR